MPLTLQDQLFQLQQSLHQLALAIQQAEASGQPAAAAGLRAQFAATQAAAVALNAQLTGQQMPSDFMLSLANLGAGLEAWLKRAGVLAALGVGAYFFLKAWRQPRRERL